MGSLPIPLIKLTITSGDRRGPNTQFNMPMKLGLHFGDHYAAERSVREWVGLESTSDRITLSAFMMCFSIALTETLRCTAMAS